MKKKNRRMNKNIKNKQQQNLRRKRKSEGKRKN